MFDVRTSHGAWLMPQGKQLIYVDACTPDVSIPFRGSVSQSEICEKRRLFGMVVSPGANANIVKWPFQKGYYAYDWLHACATHLLYWILVNLMFCCVRAQFFSHTSSFGFIVTQYSTFAGVYCLLTASAWRRVELLSAGSVLCRFPALFCNSKCITNRMTGSQRHLNAYLSCLCNGVIAASRNIPLRSADGFMMKQAVCCPTALSFPLQHNGWTS